MNDHMLVGGGGRGRGGEGLGLEEENGLWLST